MEEHRIRRLPVVENHRPVAPHGRCPTAAWRTPRVGRVRRTQAGQLRQESMESSAVSPERCGCRCAVQRKRGPGRRVAAPRGTRCTGPARR
ncbi:hypothetical protein [Streptomyces sp. NPDC102437]|uniref:hypothetical protein n=1 Tax=Streptomyces sp. NPDC102437 TaxID=3366175 RepID=UPI003800F48D